MVSLTMIGMVGFSAAEAVWIIPAKAVAPTKLMATRRLVNELKSFMGVIFVTKTPQWGTLFQIGAAIALPDLIYKNNW